ncbi:MAG: HD domain-containing phosphohydrolase [bacterium]|nr:HD domain-containing phosphohydrolase [bacterium]
MDKTRKTIKIRWIGLIFYFLLLVLALAFVPVVRPYLGLWITLFFLVLGSNLLISLIKPKEDLSFPLILLDLFVITLLVIYTGGIESELYLLYLLPISSAIFLNISPYKTIILSFLAYILSVFLEKSLLRVAPIHSLTTSFEVISILFLRSTILILATGGLAIAQKEKERLHKDAEKKANFAIRRLRDELKLKEDFFHREFKESDFLIQNLEDNYYRMLIAMVKVRESQDPYIRGHSEKVAELSAKVAGEFGLFEKEIELIERCALIYDVGRVGIPESMFNKPDVLNDEEFELIKSHTIRSEYIASPITLLSNGLSYIRNHHERFNGTGYPDKLKGDEIPLGARIIAACDAFCAMTSERPYRRKISAAVALDELRKNAGKQHDPKVIHVLTIIVARKAHEEAEGL